MARLSRRELLTASALVGSSLALPEIASARTISEEVPWAPGVADKPSPITPGPYQFFTPHEASWIDAVVSRLIPQDEKGPGARELGVTVFLDRQFAGSTNDGAVGQLTVR